MASWYTFTNHNFTALFLTDEIRGIFAFCQSLQQYITPKACYLIICLQHIRTRKLNSIIGSAHTLALWQTSFRTSPLVIFLSHRITFLWQIADRLVTPKISQIRFDFPKKFPKTQIWEIFRDLASNLGNSNSLKPLILLDSYAAVQFPQKQNYKNTMSRKKCFSLLHSQKMQIHFRFYKSNLKVHLSPFTLLQFFCKSFWKSFRKFHSWITHLSFGCKILYTQTMQPPSNCSLLLYKIIKYRFSFLIKFGFYVQLNYLQHRIVTGFDTL